MGLFGFKSKKYDVQKEKVIPEIVDDCNATEETFRKAEEIKNLPPEELAKLLKEVLREQKGKK